MFYLRAYGPGVGPAYLQFNGFTSAKLCAESSCYTSAAIWEQTYGHGLVLRYQKGAIRV